MLITKICWKNCFLLKMIHVFVIVADDAFIKYFLRGCKYSLERTKDKLDFFNSVRAALPEWYDNWDQVESSMNILKDG